MPNILHPGTEACPKPTLLTIIIAPAGVCLVMAVLLTQDLTLILLTKNTKQNKNHLSISKVSGD